MKNIKTKMEKLKYVVRLLTVVLLLGTIAINRDGRILSQNVEEWTSSSGHKQTGPTEWITEDGSRKVSSINIAQDILGFAAPTPVVIQISDNKVIKVEALKNSETPEFMNSVLENGLLQQWDGLTLEEALNAQVDAVSGATMSSLALIKTVCRTLEYAASVESQSTIEWFDWKTAIGLLVVVFGIMQSFIKYKSKRLRDVQLILNVVVLGIWCGSFLSLSLIVNWIANGVNFWTAISTLSLLMIVIIMPLLGKKNTYCIWLCPMGSLQELTGKTVKYKLSISQRVIKKLTKFREVLFMALLFTMWVGVGFEIMNYEVFTVFLFQQASVVVLIAGVIFVVLSFVIQRPYCRFVCPTGSLFKLLDK